MEKSYCYRGALGDDREEMAAGEGEEEGVGFAEGGKGSGLVVEEGFVAKIVADPKLTDGFHPFVFNLDSSFCDEVDPVGDLSWSENLFAGVVIVFVEFFGNC